MSRTSKTCCFSLIPFFFIMMFVACGFVRESIARESSTTENCMSAKDVYAAGVKLLNYNERRAAFQKAVDLCPSYAEAHVNLADAFEHLGLSKKENFKGVQEANKLLDEALKHYSQALELKPDLIAARLGMADVFMAQGRYPLAAENYKKVLSSRPGFHGVDSRLREAENRARSASGKLKMASEIASDAKKSDLKSMYKTMGFEDYVIKDSDRQSFNNILFDGWSAAIRPGEPINQLNEIGKALASKEMASYRFIIEGHANAVGQADRNMNLSNERAEAVRDYLSKNFGIHQERMIVQGFGYSRPKHNPATDSQNRRVEIVFFNEENNK